MESKNLQLIVGDTSFLNELILGILVPGRVWKPLPHFLQTCLRNYIGVILLYFIIGFSWSFYLYYWKRHVYVPQDKIPTKETMLWHIRVSMKSLHWYSLVPSVGEYMTENGWTSCFPRISNVGLLSYIVYTAIYILVVEFGMYWVHRISHDVKPYYNYLHAQHHNFNKDNLLSPFAGLALNPLDGVLIGVPHVFAIFMVPMHFATHMVLLIMEAFWAASAHDNIDVNIWPVMGAGFHKVHHRKNKYNYGHYTILMDWIFGTLCYPSSQEQSNKAM